MRRNLSRWLCLICTLVLLALLEQGNALSQVAHDSAANQVQTCVGSPYVAIGRQMMVAHIVSKAELTSPLLATVSAHARIAVRVFVSDDGKVECAKALSGGTPFLRRLSEQAAMKWRFSPVTENGASVPFQGTIHFQIDL